MNKQSGVALLTMVGVMLALSLLVGAGFQQSLFVMRLAANSSEQQMALAAADFVLRKAEAAPETLAIDELTPSPMTTMAWRFAIENQGVSRSLPSPLANKATARVLVEQLEHSDSGIRYRITALGRSASGQAERILQVHRVENENSRSWRQLR